ncbi:hypothetical protein QQ045_006482 [Rhodiola kirilowii]
MNLNDAYVEPLHRELDLTLFASEEVEETSGAAADSDLTEALFKVFDENGDGFISDVELQRVLAKLGFVEGIGNVEIFFLMKQEMLRFGWSK